MQLYCTPVLKILHHPPDFLKQLALKIPTLVTYSRCLDKVLDFSGNVSTCTQLVINKLERGGRGEGKGMNGEDKHNGQGKERKERGKGKWKIERE